MSTTNGSIAFTKAHPAGPTVEARRCPTLSALEGRRMRILATGAAGTVGGYLPDGVIRTDIEELDVSDRDAVKEAFERHSPDAILHLAAETDVDRCEREPQRAFLHNALGTRNVALECRRRDLRLAYVSTAGVFFGDKPDPYHEFD